MPKRKADAELARATDAEDQQRFPAVYALLGSVPEFLSDFGYAMYKKDGGFELLGQMSLGEETLEIMDVVECTAPADELNRVIPLLSFPGTGGACGFWITKDQIGNVTEDTLRTAPICFICGGDEAYIVGRNFEDMLAVFHSGWFGEDASGSLPEPGSVFTPNLETEDECWPELYANLQKYIESTAIQPVSREGLGQHVEDHLKPLCSAFENWLYSNDS